MYPSVEKQVSDSRVRAGYDPKKAQQQYQGSKQLVDLLATQSLITEKKEKAAALAEQAPKPSAQSIAEQKEGELHALSAQEVARNMGMPRPPMMPPQGGIAGLPPGGQRPMPPRGQQGGIANLPSGPQRPMPQQAPQRFQGGGLVGMREARADKMRKLIDTAMAAGGQPEEIMKLLEGSPEAIDYLVSQYNVQSPANGGSPPVGGEFGENPLSEPERFTASHANRQRERLTKEREEGGIMDKAMDMGGQFVDKMISAHPMNIPRLGHKLEGAFNDAEEGIGKLFDVMEPNPNYGGIGSLGTAAESGRNAITDAMKSVDTPVGVIDKLLGGTGGVDEPKATAPAQTENTETEDDPNRSGYESREDGRPSLQKGNQNPLDSLLQELNSPKKQFFDDMATALRGAQNGGMGGIGPAFADQRERDRQGVMALMDKQDADRQKASDRAFERAMKVIEVTAAARDADSPMAEQLSSRIVQMTLEMMDMNPKQQAKMKPQLDFLKQQYEQETNGAMSAEEIIRIVSKEMGLAEMQDRFSLEGVKR